MGRAFVQSGEAGAGWTRGPGTCLESPVPVISEMKSAPITVLRAVQMLDFNSVTPASMQAFQGKPRARLLVFLPKRTMQNLGQKPIILKGFGQCSKFKISRRRLD